MSFGNKMIEYVWRKANIIPGVNPSIKRKDICGATIAKSAYGDHNSAFGWDIDHIYPVSKGGKDDLRNLQPLHYKNNQSKGDNPNNPNRYCVVKR